MAAFAGNQGYKGCTAAGTTVVSALCHARPAHHTGMVDQY